MITRRLRNKTVFDRFCIGIAEIELKKNCLRLTNEEFSKFRQSDEIKEKARYKLNELDLADKLYEDSNCPNFETIEICRDRAKRIMKKIIPELIPNLEEWLDGEETSEIKVNNMCVNDVIKLNKYRNVSALDAILCLSAWKDQNFADKHFCEYYFAIK